MSIDGKWNVELNTPMGIQKIAIVFKVDGETLSGSMGGGMMSGTTEFEGGTVSGDKVSWPLKITQPMSMTLKCTATIDGDNITGEASMGMMGKAKFAGSRAA